jgi:hypothetical protein
VRAGGFESKGSRDHTVALASYRLFLAALDTSVEGTFGQFYNNDRGATVEVRRYFGDTAITLFYSQTEEKIGGFRISLPLTPRRDLKPSLLQVRGADRWSYGLSTTLGREGGNPLAFGVAEIPQTAHNLERTYYNTDRLSEGYIREHVSRLREAYLLWGNGLKP